MDYQRDPATEQDRQQWADFFERQHALQRQIREWDAASTPTASDIALKESRLKELQQELDRLELQKRQSRGDYYPVRKRLDADTVAQPPDDYIACPKAMKILKEKWQATPEELAAWIFYGPEIGGITAYLNANELSTPPTFSFAYHTACEDYLSPLMACWFRQEEIDRFVPADRYITGAALIERWGRQPGILPEAFIRAKIAESRLLDMSPTFGGTQGSFDNGANYPPLSAGLFSLKEIEQIEAEDGLDSVPVLPDSGAGPVRNDASRKGGRPKEPLAEAVEMAYLHFHATGNVDILKPGNIRAFLKSFSSLVKADNPLVKSGNGNVTRRIADRIKEVKIPREGKCFITTLDRPDGKKINPGRRYSQEAITKLLTELRDKHPLPV